MYELQIEHADEVGMEAEELVQLGSGNVGEEQLI
jgi:hypothetical protein